MKKILLIHPEGNFNYNPSLISILEWLVENQYQIDILCKKYNHINQEAHIKYVNIYYYNSFNVSIINNQFDLQNELSELDLKSYQLVLAVDLGVIIAHKVNHLFLIPYALLSYEMYFGDERLTFDKGKEIEACSKLSFVISTDIIRGLILSVENEISMSKIICIPLSSPYTGPYPKSNYLRNKLGIPPEKKIAICIGSLTGWSMYENIIEQSRLWKDDWVLVLHDRYGINYKLQKHLKKRRNIFINTDSFSKIEDIRNVILSSDIGIALYQPIYQSQYDGKNILHIGLSSGKISKYLQYGLPILINETGMASYLVKKYNCGKVINDKKNINPSQFGEENLRDLGYNATKLFLEKYDFNLYKQEILLLVNQAIIGTEIIVDNRIEYLEILRSQIDQLNSEVFNNKLYKNQKKINIRKKIKSVMLQLKQEFKKIIILCN